MSTFQFGTPAASVAPTTSATPTFGTFGTPKPATATPVSATATPAAATTGFGTPMSIFATPTPVANPTGLTFGIGAGTAVSSSASAPIPLTFGSTTAGASTLMNPTGGLLSNTATNTTATTANAAPSLFSNTSLSTAAPAPATNLTFGSLTATTSSQPTLGGFNTMPSFGTTGTLFSAKPSVTTVTTSTTTTTMMNKGLGGLDVSLNVKGLSHGRSSPTVAKENLIPNELVQTIEGFKEFVKTQKGFSSDIARGSSRPLNRCAEDIASLMEILTILAGSVQRDRSLADKLKQDTAKALQNAEIAQRTHDTPPGLQYENNAPLHFFMELAENFEQDLMLFRSQIEATEKHIQAMMAPRAFTPQELTITMSKIHESFIAVAGKLQGVHAKVQQQKEQYLNLRKYILKDSSNVFEDIKVTGKNSRTSISKISGPTPFAPGNTTFLSSTMNSLRQPNYGTSNPLAWVNATPGTTVSNISTMKPPTTSLNFNTSLNLTAPLSTNETNSSFQLQKPPVGHKRGKHVYK